MIISGRTRARPQMIRRNAAIRPYVFYLLLLLLLLRRSRVVVHNNNNNNNACNIAERVEDLVPIRFCSRVQRFRFKRAPTGCGVRSVS